MCTGRCMPDHSFGSSRGNRKFQSRLKFDREQFRGTPVDLNLNTILTDVLGIDFSAAKRTQRDQTQI